MVLILVVEKCFPGTSVADVFHAAILGICSTSNDGGEKKKYLQ